MLTVDTEPRYRLCLPPIKKVIFALVGCGGTGSALAIHLARLMHDLRTRNITSSMYLIDHDVVEPSNIGRQQFAECEVRCNKAITLMQRLTAWLGLDILACPMSVPGAFEHLHLPHSRPGFPVIFFGAVDNHYARTAIARERLRLNAWWIDGGNDLFAGQVLIGNAGHEPITADALKMLSALPDPSIQAPGLLQPPATDIPQVACGEALDLGAQSLFINSAVAVLMAQYAYDLLVRRELTSLGAAINLAPMTTTHSPLTATYFKTLGIDIKEGSAVSED